jgi:hypothetical protein
MPADWARRYVQELASGAAKEARAGPAALHPVSHATRDVNLGRLQRCRPYRAFGVERKSIPDLVGCCMAENRQRFERELHRLRGFRFKRLLIVGTKQEIEAGQYRSNISPQAVLAGLNAFEMRYDLLAVFCQVQSLRPAKSRCGLIGLLEKWLRSSTIFGDPTARVGPSPSRASSSEWPSGMPLSRLGFSDHRHSVRRCSQRYLEPIDCMGQQKFRLF